MTKFRFQSRNQDLILNDLSILHEIILIKTSSKQRFADVHQDRSLLKRDSNTGVVQ